MGYVKLSAPPTIGNVTQNTGQFSTVGVGAAAVTSALYVNASNRIGAWVTGTNISSGADADGIFVDASFAPSANVGNAASIGLYPTFNPGGGVTITTGYGLYVASGTQGGAGAVTTGYGLFVTHPTFGTTNYAAQIDNLRVDLNSITATNANGSVSVLSDGSGAANFGTNATAHTTTLGSTTTTATTAVQSGSGGITIATSSNGTIGITSGTGTISLSADATNTTVNLATGAGVKLTTVGSTNGASSLTLNAGSAGIIMPSLTGILTGNGASKLTASTVTQHGVLVGGASNAVSSTAVGSTGQVLQGNTGADPTYSTATFPSTATSTGTILRADGTNWVATTATYPATTTSQQILYSTANNVIGQLTTANSKFPATNSSGTLAMRALSVTRQIFTSTGTYTPTAGMVYCDIQVVGSGGGSGGIATTGGGQCSVSGGGGGGGYAQGTFSAATIGASQSVTIGAAGTAGSAGNNAGGTGGTCSVGALISATGGVGGSGGAAGGAGQSAGGAGGAGTGGDFQTNGEPGTYGIGTGSAANAFIYGGNGGNSFFGGGAQGSITANGAGSAGVSYGGGGGGVCNYVSQTQIAGAAGAKGVVIVTEYIIA